MRSNHSSSRRVPNMGAHHACRFSARASRERFIPDSSNGCERVPKARRRIGGRALFLRFPGTVIPILTPNDEEWMLPDRQIGDRKPGQGSSKRTRSPEASSLPCLGICVDGTHPPLRPVKPTVLKPSRRSQSVTP